jgi:hypothetical protein
MRLARGLLNSPSDAAHETAKGLSSETQDNIRDLDVRSKVGVNPEAPGYLVKVVSGREDEDIAVKDRL